MESFAVKPEIRIERDLAKGIAEILEGEKSSTVLVFADMHVYQHPQVSRMMEAISEGRKTELVKLPEGEPTTAMVNEYADAYRDWADWKEGNGMLIAIGGGAVMDFTKALSGMLIYEGKVERYQLELIPYQNDVVKKIAVPTTAGTGAEIAKYGVLINEETKYKRGVTGPGVPPNYALLCAELGVTLPVGPTVACGMDAMAHAMESYVSAWATRMSKMYSKEAFVRLFHALPKVVEDLTNIDLREEMLYGACLAGCAITNANTGACHGMCYAPGVYFKVPHGVAVSIFYVETMLINIEKGCTTPYAELYEALGYERSGDDEKDAFAFAEVMRNYEPLVKYSKTLFDYGVKQEDCEWLAKEAMKNVGGFRSNPVPCDLNDGLRCYRKALNIEG